jgi:hypothetical protein
MSKNSGISRSEMLKNIGVAVGSTLIAPSLRAESSGISSVRSTSSSPSVVGGRASPTSSESRLKVLKGNTPSNWYRTLYCHYYEFISNHWAFPYYGVRTNRYKLINYYTENERELFDLDKDPGEMENLFDWGAVKSIKDMAK